jgi:1-phosphofructokinase family hexose kinase
VVVTLTPNPGFDRTMLVDQLGIGAVNRALHSTVEAGGKGINVARALARAGVASTAVFPANGADTEALRALLDDHDGAMALQVSSIREAVRSNLSVIDADGTTTKFNEAGPTLDSEEVAALIATTVLEVERRSGTWLACCGSLPAGAGDDFHARLIDAVRGHSTRVAVDASGDGLRQAIAASPALIKPNTSELADAVGATFSTVGEVVDAASALVAGGIEQVLVSMGSDGALLVDANGAIHAWSEPVVVKNTVGAGDAMLAGFLSAGGLGETALRTSVAWGAAAVQSETTAFIPPAPGSGVQVTVEVPDGQTVLGDT